MKEELGDILLQVVMHSQIANEEGLFSIDDVISEVSEKMIRRHPHVFGSIKADTADEVIKETVSKLEIALSNDVSDKDTIEKHMANCLFLLSNIAMKNKISSEQILTDKIDEIIDKYEPKNCK